MPHVLRVIACILVLLPMAAGPVWSVGLGRVSDATVLGGPMDFSVALNLAPGEVLSSGCVSAEVLVGESRVPSHQVHVFLQRSGDATVQALRVRTDTRIDEPVATITLRVGCPVRLVRQFVALIDPPTLADVPAAQANGGSQPLQDVPHDGSIAAQLRAAAVGSAAASAAAPGDELPRIAPSANAPRSTAAAPAPAKRPRAAAARRAQSPSAVASRPETKPARAAGGASVLAARPAADGASRASAGLKEASARAAAKPVAEPTSRLSLDPPVPRVPAAVSAAPAPAGAAASGSAVSEDRALAEGRLAALEASLNKLQAENEANKARMLALQARLQQAESARYANPLVFALLALVLLMATALLFMFKRQRRLKLQRPPWWDASVMPSSQADSSLHSRFDDPLPPMTPQDVWPTQPPPLSRAKPVARQSPPPAQAAAAPQSAASPTAPMPLAGGEPGLSLIPPKRPVAVEELIDLEQQAEFFRVLGQEQSAIDLLMSHLRESGAGSPMPYLKLLDIHRRRGDRDDYERIRTRFNERFSAYAPEWGADLGAGGSLENYPEVLSELQRLWVAPKQAMARLETLLFRHDDADTTFELPAYLQLLFLFSVARDLADTEIDPSTVDLLLPIS